MRRQTPPVLTILATAALTMTACTSGADPEPEPTTEPTAAATATTSPSPSPTESVAASPTASPSPSPSPSPAGDVAAMEFTACEAEEYTVAHPADWDVNDPESLLDACRIFHPGTVDVPDEPQGLDLHWAVTIRIDQVPFEDATSAEVQGELLRERQTTVAGRDAVVTEVRSDGVAMVPAGELTYGYAVDLGDRTMFVQTHSVGETDYERDKQVVDRMAGELELTLDSQG